MLGNQRLWLYNLCLNLNKRVIALVTKPPPNEWKFSKLTRLLAVSLILGLSAELSLQSSPSPIPIPFLWVPTGLALGLILLRGLQVWPALLVGLLGFHLAQGLDFVGSALHALVESLPVLLGAWVLKKLRFRACLLDNYRDVLKLLVFGGLASSFIGSIPGVLLLATELDHEGPAVLMYWRNWILRDVFSVLLLTPVLICWSNSKEPQGDRPHQLELTTFYLALIATTSFVFVAFANPQRVGEPLAYFLLPFLVWVTLRFQTRDVVLTSLITTMIASLGTRFGLGPFADSQNTDQLGLVTFLGAVAFVSVLVKSVLTERDQVFQKLATQQERMELALRGASAGLWDWDIVSGVVHANERWAEMLGYELHHIDTQIEDRMAMIHDEDRPAVECARDDHLTGKTKTYSCQYRMKTKQGQWRWILDSGQVMRRDRDGRPLRMTGTHKDITDQRKAETEREALGRLAQKLTLAVSVEEVGATLAQEARDLFQYDVFGLYQFNEENDSSHLVHSDSSDGFESDGDGVSKPRREALKTIIQHDGKATLINRADSQDSRDTAHLSGPVSKSLLFVPVRWESRVLGVLTVHSCSPQFYGEDDLKLLQTFADQCSGALARCRAESEREHLEAQMRHTQKLESLGVLAGGIAHDFNNLLLAIMGNAGLALLDQNQDSTMRPRLLDIQKAAERAAELCRQLLAYSGRGKIVIQSVDLNEVARDMAQLLEVSISKKAVLNYELDEDLPPVEADTAQIRQVVMNLITNASDALDDQEGVITVRAGSMYCDRHYLSEAYLDELRPEGEYVFVEVSDTGCGIEKGMLDKIFDPFFTTKFTGRGLGMAAVLGIVRGHRGAIRVKSERGQGSSFTILLPVASRELKTVRDDTLPARKIEGQGLVLVVDDEDAVRGLAKQVFQRSGFRVELASDGWEAIRIYKDLIESGQSRELALVLLDMTMPHLNGEETLRELHGICPDIPVILSSGYHEQEVQNRFHGLGFAGFLQKPYNPGDLSNKVGEVLGRVSES